MYKVIHFQIYFAVQGKINQPEIKLVTYRLFMSDYLADKEHLSAQKKLYVSSVSIKILQLP